MNRFARLVFFPAVLLCAANAFAQQDDEKVADAEGCSDSLIIVRVEGSVLRSCDHREMGAAQMPLGNDEEGVFIEKNVEGEYQFWDYVLPDGLGDEQIFSALETALGSGGFTIDYSVSPTTITAHKDNTWCLVRNNGSYYDQTVVTAKDLPPPLLVDASSLAAEIEKNGHVAVYGIVFDTDSDALLADSQKALREIAKLLFQKPNLNLRVDGHTDSNGNPTVDKELSEKRAKAIVAWLVAHGVKASRLSAKGAGQSKPIADNSTEEGRARNNRFELVRQKQDPV